MGAVSVHDGSGALSVELRDILRALGDAARDGVWTVGDLDGEELWVTGAACADVTAIADSGERVAGRALLALAERIHQTIWGDFRGYRSIEDAEPFVVVSAIDGVFFTVSAPDDDLIDQIRAAFADVRDERYLTP